RCTCSGRSASSPSTASRVAGSSRPSSGRRCSARRRATVRGCTVCACARSPARRASSRGIARSWHLRAAHADRNFGTERNLWGGHRPGGVPSGSTSFCGLDHRRNEAYRSRMAVQSVEAPADLRDTALPGYAVAAIREEGRWRCARMAAEALVDLDAAITELRSLRSTGAVLGLLDVDDEFFVLLRPTPGGVALMVSDVLAAESELYPDEQLAAIGRRCGFGDALAEVVDG